VLVVFACSGEWDWGHVAPHYTTLVAQDAQAATVRVSTAIIMLLTAQRALIRTIQPSDIVLILERYFDCEDEQH
jgi:hypothetical protein